MSDIIKAFLWGAIFLFSAVWTRNYIGDVVYLGELPSLAYAISACVSSMLMLGSIIVLMSYCRNQTPPRNRRH